MSLLFLLLSIFTYAPLLFLLRLLSTGCSVILFELVSICWIIIILFIYQSNLEETQKTNKLKYQYFI